MEFSLSNCKSTFYFINFEMPATAVSPHSESSSETDILVSQGNDLRYINMRVTTDTHTSTMSRL